MNKHASFFFVCVLAFACAVATVNAQINTGAAVKAAAEIGTGAINASVTSGATVKLAGNATSSAVHERNDDRQDGDDDDDADGTTTKSGSSGGSMVSVSARDIRGWDEGEKQRFMLVVKSHAQIQSGQDLDNFAKGILLADEHVDAVASDDGHVEVSYKLPAKFLGIFSTELAATAGVTVDASGNATGQKEVTVKFPWYASFFTLDESEREDAIKTAVQNAVDAQAAIGIDASAGGKARTISLVSSVLKSVRAAIDADAVVAQ